jgi:hypothetical protein
MLMKTKMLMVAGLAVFIIIIIAGVLNRKHEVISATPPQPITAAQPNPTATPAPGPASAIVVASIPAEAEPTIKSEPPTKAVSVANPLPTVASANPAKEPIKDPKAREALALVGLDPEAEAYWYAAINDPNLSAKERQDLIEDLNEDGLSDPKHPSPDDLPTILSRLELIEAVAPDAMDKVNADAFKEAYKDLVNLANVATGGGEPVD